MTTTKKEKGNYYILLNGAGTVPLGVHQPHGAKQKLLSVLQSCTNRSQGNRSIIDVESTLIGLAAVIWSMRLDQIKVTYRHRLALRIGPNTFLQNQNSWYFAIRPHTVSAQGIGT